jgi:nicotinamide mononucleotide transporter
MEILNSFNKFFISFQIEDLLLSLFSLGNISLITGILYLFCLVKEKRIAWVYAFISSSILSYIYFSESVYMQTLLSVCYSLMAIYGFVQWSKKNKEKKKTLKISEYPVKIHLILVFVTILISGSVATFLSIIIYSAYSTLDAIIFAFSIVATYLQVNKIVSNWLYWCVIDVLSIILLLYLSLYSVALLMLLYFCLALWGYAKWKKQLIKQIH